MLGGVTAGMNPALGLIFNGAGEDAGLAPRRRRGGPCLTLRHFATYATTGVTGMEASSIRARQGADV